ncbi:heptaprenyl diphosphate synthase [Pelagirhabdus alkalitolerans]|uniref:Heptaprenyl diphosphate synthase n=1 Tax=Pelagirhabdus alkalitolerans TaxID=1612202 RepID=A0A1G6HAS9_9BACI|nr:polyprenyl synthetase family protein [Pelagirhabdus alkalitolerans]SDB91321.1 heptaprenyl diphosphate synthase [Pelagirhabdus alkalitolerans]
MEIPKRFDLIRQDLNDCNDLLINWLSSMPLRIKEPALELVTGGKRIRPILVITSSYYVEADRKRILHLAAIFELIHLASLIHDDVIDDADMRRDKPTLHKAQTTLYAINVANYLFAFALRKLTELNSTRLHCVMSRLLVDLTNGELMQLNSRNKLDKSVKTYLRKVRQKTAHFIGVSMQAPGLLLDSDTRIERDLYQFGYFFGMAFQIYDDLMDFHSYDRGKDTQLDLSDGYLTLPTILALDEKNIYDKVQQLFSGVLDDIDYQRLISEVRYDKGFNQSIQVKQWYLLKATKQLKKLPRKRETYILSSLVASLNNHPIDLFEK